MSRAIVCLVAGLLWQTPSSQPARDTPAATAATGRAVVRGRVLDAATGRGLSRVQVRANAPNPNPASPPTTPYPWMAFTDGEGRYEIKNVPAGKYTLKTWSEDGKPTTQAVDLSAATATVDLTVKK